MVLEIYKPISLDDDNEDDTKEDNSLLKIIKTMKKNDILHYKKIIANEKFTKPIGRYNEPSLIKKLEDLGIGRPSTYANIIDKIQEREYVKKDSKKGIEIDLSILTLSNNGSISEKLKKQKTVKNKLATA